MSDLNKHDVEDRRENFIQEILVKRLRKRRFRDLLLLVKLVLLQVYSSRGGLKDSGAYRVRDAG